MYVSLFVFLFASFIYFSILRRIVRYFKDKKVAQQSI